jgi:hypothetical protein
LKLENEIDSTHLISYTLFISPSIEGVVRNKSLMSVDLLLL